NRSKNQREALLKSLARSLVLKEKIRTTESKAKSLRPFVERIVTQGKKGTLASKRASIALIGVEPTKKMFDVLVKRYEGRTGGYTRIVKLPRRISDGSTMAVIEFV
ncbi:MAG: hypothetical protein RJA61_145, partial [Candidatus Parcubacteria bacterium]